ncbi:hypothetical protein MBEHAL_0418 [Halarchaeum acidiphilum MH1-52-1]|uniref:Small CPxCG-related zinc finger protein n=1 Tax=Halarchaeum acidiphilum MH1-52-1 TaxID=1261545 RepID=U3AA65_9EURY|nr:hypothetical protein MBEHAL_0418 [Halarchaeum acidiphilum MH1-52-1]
MSQPRYEQCAVCGWTGERTDLDASGDEYRCPVCGEHIA